MIFNRILLMKLNENMKAIVPIPKGSNVFTESQFTAADNLMITVYCSKTSGSALLTYPDGTSCTLSTRAELGRVLGPFFVPKGTVIKPGTMTTIEYFRCDFVEIELDNNTLLGINGGGNPSEVFHAANLENREVAA